MKIIRKMSRPVVGEQSMLHSPALNIPEFIKVSERLRFLGQKPCALQFCLWALDHSAPTANRQNSPWKWQISRQLDWYQHDHLLLPISHLNEAFLFRDIFCGWYLHPSEWRYNQEISFCSYSSPHSNNTFPTWGNGWGLTLPIPEKSESPEPSAQDPEGAFSCKHCNIQASMRSCSGYLLEVICMMSTRSICGWR